MTMHVNLSPEMESYIKAKVSSGFYGNATEVIRDAIRRMQAEEERVVVGTARSYSKVTRSLSEGRDQYHRGIDGEDHAGGVAEHAQQKADGS